MRSNYKVLAALSFLLAIALRVFLCWSNPAENAFDDHFRPILMIMASGAIPAKDACWQCYHPPVFYWVSAMAGNMALTMEEIQYPQVPKLLQWLPCLYGILTVGTTRSHPPKIALVRFLEADGFCDGVLSAPSYLHVGDEFKRQHQLSLCRAQHLSAHHRNRAEIKPSKPCGGECRRIDRRVYKIYGVCRVARYSDCVRLPVLQAAHRFQKTGPGFLSAGDACAHPAVERLFHIERERLRQSAALEREPVTPLFHSARYVDGGLDFVSFKPWESIGTPIIVPGKMHSFWTLVYSGMWFDNEPKFLDFLDSNREWWKHYWGWLRGEESYPGWNPSMSNLTKSTGSGLIALGLVPLLFILIGIYHFFRGNWKRWTKTEDLDAVKMNIFPALLFSNAAGIIALAVRLPVYSSAKASYFLNSLPAFAVFLSLGLMPCEKSRKLKWAVVAAFCVLFALASLHILQIHEAVRTKPAYQEAEMKPKPAPMQQAETPKAAPEKIAIPPSDPDTAEGRLRMGLALSQEGKTDEAVRKYEEALRLDPNLVAAHVSLGLIMAQKRDLDKAIFHFRKALKIKPDIAEVHNSLGVALIFKGDLDGAVEHLETAIKINPKFAKAHNSLAVALAKKGRTEEAIRHLSEAVQLQPDNEEAKKNLKIMLEMQGKSP